MAARAPDDEQALPDRRWLERFQRGDRLVLSEVYRTHFSGVRKAVARVLAEAADQDNVVQQVFADLVESHDMRESYAGGNFGAWLGAIARHRAIDFGRRQARLVTIDDDAVGARMEHAGHTPLHDFRTDLERFAAVLPNDRRAMLKLRFIDGLTQVEASRTLGVPRSTLEDWERQMKAELRRFLLGDALGAAK